MYCLRAIFAFARFFMLGLTVLASTHMYGLGLNPLENGVGETYPYSTVGKVISNDGNVATGTLIANKLVLTSAGNFQKSLSRNVRADHFRWVWKSSGDSSEREYSVVAVHVFENYLSVASSWGAEAAPAMEKSVMILELGDQFDSDPSALMNFENLSSESYRMVVGYAGDLYEENNSVRSKLHATGGGEAVETNFGRVEGRLYHTGDVKASIEASGAPIFSFYDGLWSIDGIVVMNDGVEGTCNVLQVDGGLADFVGTVMSNSTATVVVPELDLINQDANGDKKYATPLEVGYGRLFSIAPQADADYHKFRISEAGNFTIESFGGLDVNGTLLNSSGQLIIDDDDSAGSVDYRINVALKPGDYYLWTKPNSTEISGVYGISLENDDASFSGFSDNGINGNTVLDLGSNVDFAAYHLSTSGEVDTFRVVVSSPGHLIIKTGGELDLMAKVFSTKAGTSAPYDLGEIETLWDINDDFSGMGGNSVLDKFLPVGEYIVSIEASNSGEFGPYSLTSAFYQESLPVQDFDDNTNGFASAIDWNPGEKVSSEFDRAGDRDTYKFEINTTTAVSISVKCGTDVVWYLFDEELNRVAFSDAAKVDPVIEHDLGTGIYYLVLAGFSEQTYTLE